MKMRPIKRFGYFNIILFLGTLSYLGWLNPVYGAQRAPLANFCKALAGQWEGSASQPLRQPKMVGVDAICSADTRQLIFSVSEHASHSFSETWWFRDVEPEVSLLYYNGVDEDKYQSFSLYQDRDTFTLLGRGIVKQRPALIQLRFERQAQGWLWLQNLQYLDEDDDHYRLYRAIAMQPK